MTTLTKLQDDFQSYILGNKPDFQKSVVEQGLSAEERLEVYGTAYRLRLIEVLEQTFPVLAEMIGPEAFGELASDYLTAYPSDHFSVNQIGRSLADFLSETTPYQSQQELAEVAQFEWAFNIVTDAKDETSLTEADFVEIEENQWPIVKLRLHGSLKILELHYNTPKIWDAVMNEDVPPEITKHESYQTWIMWRCDYDEYYRLCEAPEAWMLTAFRSGQSFGEVCDGLTQWYGENELIQFAVQTLQRWIADGLVVDIL